VAGGEVVCVAGIALSLDNAILSVVTLAKYKSTEGGMASQTLMEQPWKFGS